MPRTAGRGLLIFKNYGDMPAKSCSAQDQPANAFVVAVNAAIMGDLAENVTLRLLFDGPPFQIRIIVDFGMVNVLTYFGTNHENAAHVGLTGISGIYQVNLCFELNGHGETI